MGRGPATFRQIDVTRAFKAALAAGVELERIEIDKAGRIVIVPIKPTHAREEELTHVGHEDEATQNEWDGAL